MNKHFFLLALGAMAGSSQAVALDYGNVAPIQGRFELRVNGENVGQPGYLEFGHADIAEGAITVEARSVDNGSVVASETFDLAPEPGVRPIVLLQGNGIAQPFALVLHQRVYSERGGQPGDVIDDVYVARHHVALFSEASAAPLEGQQWCSGRGPGRFRFGGGLGTMDWYYGAARGIALSRDVDYAEKECGLLVQGDFGSVRLAVPYDLERDTRFVFAGDGGAFPYTLVAIREGGEVLASAGLSEPSPGAIVESQHLWYDLARPAQAVALYPLVGSDALAAYWLTHDEPGNSRWYFLDGTRVGTAKYELSVYVPPEVRIVPPKPSAPRSCCTSIATTRRSG